MWLSAERVNWHLFEECWRFSAWGVWTLSVTWGRLVVVCSGVCVLRQLLEAGLLLSTWGLYSINYGALTVVWGRVCNLTVTWGRLEVVCRWVCNLYVTWGRLEVVCRWVCNLSVTWGRLAVVCRGCEVCQFGYKYGGKRMQRIQLMIEGRIGDGPDTNTD
jgi:hypothetical protein